MYRNVALDAELSLALGVEMQLLQVEVQFSGEPYDST